MNNSTENVTLYTAFVNDILKNYEEDRVLYGELFNIVDSYDLSNPTEPISIDVYNQVCSWVENKLGKVNLTRTGRNVGGTVYQMMFDNGLINEMSTPLQLMQAVADISKTVVQDPLNRGFDVIDSTETSVTMRRTQVFNRNLQFGVLEGVLRKAKVFGVRISYIKEVTNGDEFDDYRITWKNL